MSRPLLGQELTAQQVRIIRLLGRGYGLREMALKLETTTNVVNVQLTCIVKKFGLTSRDDLRKAAVELHIDREVARRLAARDTQ